MGHQLRITPWSSHQEWKHVAGLVEEAMEEDSDGEDLQAALHWLNIWMMRGNVPPTVETTYNLLCIKKNLISHQDATNVDYGELQTRQRCIQLALAASLVRFVNEIVDPEQQGMFAKPVSVLAERKEVPRMLVDLRHTATHDALPSLEVLRLGMKDMFQWLRRQYWEPVWAAEEVIREKAALVLDRFVEAMKTYDPLTRSVAEMAAQHLDRLPHLDCSLEIQQAFLLAILQTIHPIDQILPLVLWLVERDPDALVRLTELLLSEPPHLHGLALVTEMVTNLDFPSSTILALLKMALKSDHPLAGAVVDLLMAKKANVIPSDLRDLVDSMHQRVGPIHDSDYLINQTDQFLEDHPPTTNHLSDKRPHKPSKWQPRPFGCTESFNPITDFMFWEGSK